MYLVRLRIRFSSWQKPDFILTLRFSFERISSIKYILRFFFTPFEYFNLFGTIYWTIFNHDSQLMFDCNCFWCSASLLSSLSHRETSITLGTLLQFRLQMNGICICMCTIDRHQMEIHCLHAYINGSYANCRHIESIFLPLPFDWTFIFFWWEKKIKKTLPLVVGWKFNIFVPQFFSQSATTNLF